MLLVGFDNVEDIANQYKTELKDEIILFGFYSNEDYEGYSWVVFLKNDKIYEVHGSHCSCYGLENQWEPEETSVAEIIYRLDNGGQPAYVKEHELIRKVLAPFTLKKELDDSLTHKEGEQKNKLKL